MKKVTLEVLKEASQRLMFSMTEEQYQVLLSEFSILIQQMELLSQIKNLEEVTPMTFPFTVTTSVLADDDIAKTLTQKEALKNVSQYISGQVKLPKVVG
jgi:aspartyl/glutamyl-tRNA(Asn/Gln) amidotransferase C subunit